MATRSTSRKADTAVRLDASMRIVLLRGPDQYLRSAHTKALIDALEAEQGAIEQFSFDGATTEPAVILDELRSYGLLQQHKLVIVDDADKLLAAKESDAGGRKTARELMEAYAANPVDSATLLLRAETWRPGRIDKAIQKIGAIIRCEAPDAARAVNFCIARGRKEHGCDVAPDAAAMLVDRIGPELQRLDVELAKLAAYAGDAGAIDADAVREMVGLSREEQAWEIQDALLSGSADRAVVKLRELLEISRQPEQLVIWAMTDLLRKLHAAARLLEQGVPGGAIAKELRLWGSARNAVIEVATRHDPRTLADLLAAAIRADMGTKRGLGRPGRTLETLAVRIADTISCP